MVLEFAALCSDCLVICFVEFIGMFEEFAAYCSCCMVLFFVESMGEVVAGICGFGYIAPESVFEFVA